MKEHPQFKAALVAIEREFKPPEVRRIYDSADPDRWVDVEISPVPGALHSRSWSED